MRGKGSLLVVLRHEARALPFQRDLATPWVRLSVNGSTSPKWLSFPRSIQDASSSEYFINAYSHFAPSLPRRVSTGTLVLVLCTRVGGQRPGLQKTQEPELPRETPRLPSGPCASRPCRSPKRRLRDEGCRAPSLWEAGREGYGRCRLGTLGSPLSWGGSGSHLGCRGRDRPQEPPAGQGSGAPTASQLGEQR